MDDMLDLRAGMRNGVWLYAVWKDGKQVCGIMETPLEKVYAVIDAGKYDQELRNARYFQKEEITAKLIE